MLQPINDFEIVSMFHESRFPNAEWDPKPICEAYFKHEIHKNGKDMTHIFFIEDA